MKKVLIINAYSFKNRGDSGIIVSMIDLIRKIYGYDNVEINVMSQFYESNTEFYNGYNIKSVKPIWLINSTSKNFLTKYIDGITKVFKYKEQDLKLYNEVDVVLAAGGGYLYSSRKGPLGVGFLNCLYHIWLAKKLNKKVLLFPQSVGPLNNILDKWILKKVFDKVDVFYSREFITTELSQTLNLKCKVKEVPDIAFTLNPLERDFEFSFEGSIKIGITVLDWRFAKTNSTKEDIDLYLIKIQKGINLLSKDFSGIKVYIFPQVTVSEYDGDTFVSKELKDKLGTIADVVSLEQINDPKELVYLYSKMDLFIASRMHSAIFALAGNTPTVALSYQPKTTGTFRLINNEQSALDIENFTENQLYSVLKNELNKDKKELETQIKLLKSKIENSIIEDFF